MDGKSAITNCTLQTHYCQLKIVGFFYAFIHRYHPKSSSPKHFQTTFETCSNAYETVTKRYQTASKRYRKKWGRGKNRSFLNSGWTAWIWHSDSSYKLTANCRTSVAASFGLSDFRTFRLSDFPTFRLPDFPTFRLSDFPTFRLSDFPTSGLSDFRTSGLSN